MKKALSVTLMCFMALSLVACGGGNKPTEVPATVAAGDTTTAAAVDTIAANAATASEVDAEVANRDKPLMWFNRQSSSSAIGQFDMTALNFNKDTYYIGFGIDQGAELQGTMAKDYIGKSIDSIDRNGDGIIGYVLTIGDIEHNDFIARTRGIRKALGTTVKKDGGISSDPIGTNADGIVAVVRDGPIEVGGKTYVVRELASQEMKDSVGATWDAATTGNVIGIRSSSFDDQIDVVVFNSDGMGMSMFNAWSKDNRIPALGYDANSDVVAAIVEGYGGTTNQHADIQAYLTLCVLRNALSGVDIDIGIGTADGADNVLSSDVCVYRADERSYYALDAAVTVENYIDFIDFTMVYTPVSNQLDEAPHATRNVWLNVYNPTDNFPGSAYQSLLQKHNKLLNLRVDYISDDGQTRFNITSRLGSPSQYDAFVINTAKTDNAVSCISLFEQ